MKLAIVAGEASGDLHAAEVVRELKALAPGLRTFGIGGDLLAAEGMRVLHHAKEMGIVGLFNVLRQYGKFRRIFDDMVAALSVEKPDGVMLVDYPGFNLRLAKKCKELGLRVVYYISPQVWAWRQGRVKQIEKVVDRMIVLFPFEEEFYSKHRVPVTYAGHPLIDELAGVERGDVPPRDPLRIALLPGSRKSEVTALLPPMLDAVALLQNERAVDAWIVRAPTIAAAELLDLMGRSGVIVRIEPHGAESIAAADVALSSSGTATLECAVVGTPVVVMYRLSRATHWIARRVVKVPHFSLVNIVAGKKVVPELIQHDVNGHRIAAEVREMSEPPAHARLRAELAAVRAKLGGPGASRRAAEAIMGTLTA
ncbi:MAG TPA: lipid-A-disaccharide synthase [Thermoanaerobaculia bacterium]|nr:lipid-A-disaccharide synthase [Thermoanaerobaculia bacterium]